MKITVRTYAENVIAIAVYNRDGDCVSVTLRAAKLFSEPGQALIDAVFGNVLADLIRATNDYEAVSYEWDQKSAAAGF